MVVMPTNIEAPGTGEPAGLSRRLMLTQLAAAGVLAIAGSTLLATGEAQARGDAPAAGPQPTTPQPAPAVAQRDAGEQSLARADRVESDSLDDLEFSSRRRYWRRRRYHWRRRWRRRYRRLVCRRRWIRGRLVRVCRRAWW